MTPAITTQFHKPVSAPAETAFALLRRYEYRARLHEALAALGVEDRVIVSRRLDVAPRNTTGQTLRWRLARGGSAEITWTASVKGTGDGASLLSIAVRLAAVGDTSRAEVLTAWPLLRDVANQHARRTIHAVAELADRFEQDGSAPAVAVPLRRAS